MDASTIAEPPGPAHFILQTPDYFRTVALHADDPVLLRACLLLASDRIEQLERMERGELIASS